jgi:hypothetical protein
MLDERKICNTTTLVYVLYIFKVACVHSELVSQYLQNVAPSRVKWRSKMNKRRSIYVNLALTLVLVVPVTAKDWAEWRGPARDGVSSEKNLPVRWSPAGENLAWKAPYGGRSAPIVMGDRVFIQNSVGKGEMLQERVMALNADTGKVVWEHRFNIYLSDVPPHRVGWASPVGDPATGNVYAFGVGGNLLGLTRDGKLLWERSLGEDMGLLTTHGGRTVLSLR